MMYEVCVDKSPASARRMGELAVGDLAEIVDTSTKYVHLIVLRTQNEIVAIERPDLTWSRESPLLCRKLTPGTTVTLTVK